MSAEIYIVRPAKWHDFPALSSLAFRSKASNGYDAAFMEACRDELTYTAETLSAGETWLLELSGKPVGFFDIRLETDKAEVHAMFVEPEVRGTGIGRRLWARLEQRARAMKAEALMLDADPFAVAFYEAMGCEVIGEAASGSIPGRMLPRMRKWL